MVHGTFSNSFNRKPQARAKHAAALATSARACGLRLNDRFRGTDGEDPDRSGRVPAVCRRQAFTLLEVMLVLGLLVAVAAMSAPVLSRTLDARRLRSAADDVRTEWARTRNKAMESGRTFVFRYQPASNMYSVEPWAREEDYVESSDLSALGLVPVVPSGSLTLGSDPLTAGTNRQLPEGIVFSGSDTAFDTRAELMAQQTPTAQLTDPQWSPPIFFYADGTSSTARLALSNERQQFILLSMRGLTGVVHVSDFLSAEELP